MIGRFTVAAAALLLLSANISFAASDSQTKTIKAPDGRQFVAYKSNKVKSARNKEAVSRLKLSSKKSNTVTLSAMSGSGENECSSEALEACGSNVEVWTAEFSFGFSTNYVANVKLEQVEVDGTRGPCTVTVNSGLGDAEVGCGEIEQSQIAGFLADDKSILQTIIDLFIPEIKRPIEKLERCPKVTQEGVTASSDKNNGYAFAEAAFMQAYGGALAGIQNSQSVDIKYPDGFTFTFRVLWIRFNPEGVELYNPLLNEKTTKAENKCAPE